MKPPVLVGVVLGLVIIAAALFSPLFQSAERKSAHEAQQQADLAERKLARTSLMALQLQRQTDTEALAQADMGAVLDAVSDQLGEITSEYRKRLQEVRRQAEDQNLPAPDIAVLQASAGSLQGAVSAFRTALQQEGQLLRDALADATAAENLSREALGVSFVRGMVQYAQAADQLTAAQQKRRAQAVKEAKLIDLGSMLKTAQAYRDQYRGLDVSVILGQMRQDLDELAAQSAEAQARVKELAEQVETRKAQLAEARQQLAAAQKRLLEIERDGFTAGDDASFETYRVEYERVSDRVQRLQLRTQELQDGGLRNAKLVGEQPDELRIEGGTLEIGLDELERRLAVEEERAKRLQSANTSLEEHIAYLRESSSRADGEAQRYEARIAELREKQKSLTAEIGELAKAAMEIEESALSSANAAARSFGQAQRAAGAWLRAARELQSETDPNRENERLRIILSDNYVDQAPKAAEAAARVLAGRIHALRIASAETAIATMRLFAEMNPDAVTADPAQYQELLDTATQAGKETLESAVQLYQAVATKLENQPTAWVPLAGLATTYHLLARVDSDQAAVYAGQAFETIQRAADLSGELPYADVHREFLSHMGGAAGGAAPAGEPGPGEAGGDDFFLD